MSAIPFVGSAIQGVTGLFQLGAGLFSKKPKLPEYQIPDEFNKNIKLAQSTKTLGMDKASYLNALQNIGRNQSAGLNAIRGRRGSLGAISALVQATNDSTLRLDSTDAQIRNRNFLSGTQMEMGANQQLSQQKIEKMSWEKLQPYLNAMERRNAMIGAGIQNIAGAGQSAAMVGSSMNNPYASAGKLFGKPRTFPAAPTSFGTPGYASNGPGPSYNPYE
jgi:hypothetical protein